MAPSLNMNVKQIVAFHSTINDYSSLHLDGFSSSEILYKEGIFSAANIFLNSSMFFLKLRYLIN